MLFYSHDLKCPLLIIVLPFLAWILSLWQRKCKQNKNWTALQSCHPQSNSILCSLSKYLPSTHYVPGNIPGTTDRIVDKWTQIPDFVVPTAWWYVTWIFFYSKLSRSPANLSSPFPPASAISVTTISRHTDIDTHDPKTHQTTGYQWFWIQSPVFLPLCL